MEMRFDIGHQIPEAFTRMIAGAQVMHIAKGALDGVRARTIGRQPEQGEPRVGGQPLLHGLGVMNGVMINHHLEPGIPLSRIAGIKASEQLAEQGVGVTGCDIIQQGTDRQVEGPAR
jgi:hypothetical protein